MSTTVTVIVSVEKTVSNPREVLFRTQHGAIYQTRSGQREVIFHFPSRFTALEVAEAFFVETHQMQYFFDTQCDDCTTSAAV